MSLHAILTRVKSLLPRTGAGHRASDTDAQADAVVQAAQSAAQDARQVIRNAYIPADERLKQVFGRKREMTR